MATTYASEIQPWQKAVRGRWLIFDTDAIISILAYGRLEVLEELQREAAGFAIIQPVQLELLNTNSSRQKLERSKLLIDFGFVNIALTSKHFSTAAKIQANIKDFPLPIYPRVGHVLLQDDHQMKLLTLLSLDKSLIE